ncbi:DUF2971 domain-containing protein [Sphingomonas echinoides]|uniref:DUF2971 domain-containing protein n=1 Tax=Sphingomonas echinoides TaxID=59803 RepID=A0ABU4PI95_9SPHN|nr:DUF2971 domain-containing protein [Sphingomonas echinoides]MDX5983901.1 DUF2971 domain-containing protein [Sphingomonas echinoides]
MNDYMEVKSGQQWLTHLSDIFFSENADFAYSSRLRDLVDELAEREITCFAACFCDQPDQLSQWRGYGSGGPGISIGFNAGILEKNTNLSLNTVRYDQDETIRSLEDCLKRAKARLSSNPNSAGVKSILEEAEDNIVSCIITSKNTTFIEERECRLIAKVASTGVPNVIYRTKGALLIPYLEIDLSADWQKLIPEVWIGPVNYREDTWKSVREFLDYNKLKSTELKNSASPYRA